MSSRTQAERSEGTRAALISAGRELFAERGYAAVGTEEIVRHAGVTRGALYHHFDGKRELLAAVYEQLESEIAARLGRVGRARRRGRWRRCRPGPRCSSTTASSRRSSGSCCSTRRPCWAGSGGARSARATGSA